jgi:hypothetical protein
MQYSAVERAPVLQLCSSPTSVRPTKQTNRPTMVGGPGGLVKQPADRCLVAHRELLLAHRAGRMPL